MFFYSIRKYGLLLTSGFVATTFFILLATGGAVTQEDVEDKEQVYKMLRLLGEVINKLDADYVEYVDKQKVIENAIRGALSDLDPHTTLLLPESFDALNESTSGKFGGLGIEIEEADNGGIRVIAPIKDTPADLAGMKTNDVIIAVDGISILDKSIGEAIELMRGDEGTSVELTFLRGGERQKVLIVRSVIKMRPVRSWMERDIAYIRLTGFNRNAASSLKEAIETLQSENNNVQGYILDLRQNPGGLLDQALKVSDLFLDHGEIVSVRSERANRASSALRFQAQKGDVIKGLPLVVLVDGGSASASEIVAGALHDHERAILVGAKTYGKGSVQDVLDIGVLAGMPANTYGLKITVQRYFTPSGVLIDGSGIEPDLAVAADASDSEVSTYQSERLPNDVQLSYALKEVQRLRGLRAYRNNSGSEKENTSPPQSVIVE